MLVLGWVPLRGLLGECHSSVTFSVEGCDLCQEKHNAWQICFMLTWEINEARSPSALKMSQLCWTNKNMTQEANTRIQSRLDALRENLLQWRHFILKLASREGENWELVICPNKSSTHPYPTMPNLDVCSRSEDGLWISESCTQVAAGGLYYSETHIVQKMKNTHKSEYCASQEAFH